MAVPELSATSPFCPLPPARLVPRLAGIGVVVLSLTCMGAMARQAEKAAGHVADKGTLSVERCEEHRGSGSRGSSGTYDVCFGSFRAESGRVVQGGPGLRGSYVAGEKVRVYHQGNSYRPISWRYFWGGWAFFFAGLAGVALGTMVALTGFWTKTLGESRAAWAALRRNHAPAAACVAWLFRAAGVGTAACVLLTLVSP
ncbi:hypothetical protein [Streptomyces sp. URMC 124]|uniref:hypothetical protein n=1 Tax=Streptomyces sp. URMC 124 TaxID=3423405 RepID=UPI003F1B721F